MQLKLNKMGTKKEKMQIDEDIVNEIAEKGYYIDVSSISEKNRDERTCTVNFYYEANIILDSDEDLPLKLNVDFYF